MNYDEGGQTAEAEPVITSAGTASYYQQAMSTETEGSSANLYYPLRARTGHHKRLPGFQADMVAISPWIDRRSPPYRILSMSHNLHASL